MESHASDWIESRNYPVHQAPAVYYIQPPVGLGEASFLPTIVEFPLNFAANAGALPEVAAPRLPPMPQPLPAWPSTLPSFELPVAPLSPTLATYRFPPMSTDQLPSRIQPGDKLPPLGQKIPSLLLPPAPSILAPRRSSTGQSLVGHGLVAKGSAKGGKKKAKHACKVCCISFTRAHDLKRHNTIHKTDKAFPCPNCSKRFGRRDALKRHLEVRGPNHDDFTKKASAGQPRRIRHKHAHSKESDSFPSPSPSTTDQTQYWDDCGSSGIYLGSGDPSAVSSPLIEVPTEFDWPTGLPSAPATHLDYEKLIGGDQFWQELLS